MVTRPKTGSRAAEVTRQLRESILEGKLSPGTPLREMTLARELQVSQATIREALQRLEHTGLVTRRAHVGTFVTRLSPNDVKERVLLRVLLETRAAQAAAERMTPENFRELERRLAVLGECIETGRFYETAQADLDFHRYVWQCSGNETLCGLLELLTVPLLAFISILRHHGLHRIRDVVASHEPLVEALRSRDPQQIAQAFERGATSSYESFLRDDSPRMTAAAFGFLETRAPGG